MGVGYCGHTAVGCRVAARPAERLHLCCYKPNVCKGSQGLLLLTWGQAGGIEEIPTGMTAIAFRPNGFRKTETLRKNINCPECLM